MMRAVALAMLGLYPKAWRDRYGEEVADLVRARPARARTAVDLIRGAADAWIHRRRLPGAAPPRVPVAAALSVAGVILWILWNPGVRDPASLHGVWAEAATAGEFAGQGLAARLTARHVVTTAPVVVLPAGLAGYLFFGQAFAHDGYPAGPLGDAMAGGFIVPTMLALISVSMGVVVAVRVLGHGRAGPGGLPVPIRP